MVVLREDGSRLDSTLLQIEKTRKELCLQHVPVSSLLTDNGAEVTLSRLLISAWVAKWNQPENIALLLVFSGSFHS